MKKSDASMEHTGSFRTQGVLPQLKQQRFVMIWKFIQMKS